MSQPLMLVVLMAGLFLGAPPGYAQPQLTYPYGRPLSPFVAPDPQWWAPLPPDTAVFMVVNYGITYSPPDPSCGMFTRTGGLCGTFTGWGLTNAWGNLPYLQDPYHNEKTGWDWSINVFYNWSSNIWDFITATADSGACFWVTTNNWHDSTYKALTYDKYNMAEDVPNWRTTIRADGSYIKCFVFNNLSASLTNLAVSIPALSVEFFNNWSWSNSLVRLDTWHVMDAVWAAARRQGDDLL